MRCEVCLGRCAAVLAKWVGPGACHGNSEALRVYFLNTLIRSALSEVRGHNHLQCTCTLRFVSQSRLLILDHVNNASTKQIHEHVHVVLFQSHLSL